MAWLQRDEIKNDIVLPALKKVADFDENRDWESFDFSKFTGFHKRVFIGEVFYLFNLKGKDIFLDESKLNNKTVKGFIDYLVKEQTEPLNPKRKLNLQIYNDL